MQKMKLLVTDRIDTRGFTPLKKYFTIEVKVGLGGKQLAQIIGNYEGIVTRAKTSLPKAVIEQATKLRVIGRVGLGVDNIDVSAATKQRIAVFNAPASNAAARASQTLKLMQHVLAGRHSDKSRFKGFTLGIVGFGDVGRKVAHRAVKHFGMRVLVCEPYGGVPPSVEKVTYEEMLRESDVVSLHVPLTYLTRSMVNSVTLSLCKRGIHLLNCSRRAVIDDRAIHEGLKQGTIAGFGAIAYGGDQISPLFLKHPNVVVARLKHKEDAHALGSQLNEVVEGILHYLWEEIAENLVNPQVFQKKETRHVHTLGFDTVIFDCDSTLTTIEGIIELASLVGKEAEVATLTHKVMEGSIPFEDVFEKRLEMIQPTREHLDMVGKRYIETLVEDAKGVIAAITHLGKSVYMVSGGNTLALLTLGKYLGIPSGNIYGNDLLFDATGHYVGSIGGPLRRNWGKLQIIRRIPGRKLMVGDSITDLETKECVDLFVGYGGVGRIARVEDESHLYLYCQSLAPIVVLAAGVEGCVKLLSTKYQRYIGKGLDLLFHARHAKFDRTVQSHLSNYKRLAYY